MQPASPQIGTPIVTGNGPSFSLLILSIAVTAVLVGGAVFLWQNARIEKITNDFQQQIHTLQSDVKTADESKNKMLETSKKSICVDTDGGQDHAVNGTIKYRAYDASGNITATSDAGDDCVTTVINGETKTVLREYYCDANQNVQYDYFVCPQGCSKGICL